MLSIYYPRLRLFLARLDMPPCNLLHIKILRTPLAHAQLRKKIKFTTSIHKHNHEQTTN